MYDYIKAYSVFFFWISANGESAAKFGGLDILASPTRKGFSIETIA